MKDEKHHPRFPQALSTSGLVGLKCKECTTILGKLYPGLCELGNYANQQIVQIR